MAEISSITLPNNQTYDLKVFSNHVYPYESKTYASTSYYATAANQLQSTWYFMSIRPDTWNKPWKVKFKLHTWCPSYPTCDSYTWSWITGREAAIRYANWNEMDSLGHYYISYYPLTTTGYNAGYGHAIGNSIFYATNYTNSAYYRSFEIQLYQTQNCTVTLLDTPVKWDSWTGTGTTNYGSLSNLNAFSAGLQQTGDSNDVNYQNRIYYSNQWKTYTALYRYEMLLQKDQNVLLPINAVSNNTGTTKTLTTQSFDPFGDIFYYSATSTFSANATINSNATLYKQLHAVDLRYSFNIGTTLTQYAPVYLVCTPQSDGSAKLASTPIVQTLPSSEDGLLYIFLGKAISTYQLEFYLNNPVYKYVNGKVRRIYDDSLTVNGHTVAVDVPSTAKFTDTTYTASTVSIGSASTGTAISADDITAWTTNTPTVVTPATVVTGGTTASITPVTKKTVVTGGTTASITPVTKKTVVTGGTTASITPVTKKTVVTAVTPATVVTGGTTASITPVTKKTVVTGGTTTSITPVTKKTVVTGGTTTSITPVTKKTVVTSASGATASVSNGVLTITNGSFGTGDSVTTGTAIGAYTGLTTGDSVTTGTAVTVYNSLTTGDSVTTGTAQTVITGLNTGSAASVTTGDSVTTGTAQTVVSGLTTGDSVTTGTAQTVVSGLTTGDSVTNGTAVTVYKSLTTGPAATVTAGTAASLSYTSRSIPNISVTSKNVVTGITAS